MHKDKDESFGNNLVVIGDVAKSGKHNSKYSKGSDAHAQPLGVTVHRPHHDKPLSKKLTF